MPTSVTAIIVLEREVEIPVIVIAEAIREGLREVAGIINLILELAEGTPLNPSEKKISKSVVKCSTTNITILKLSVNKVHNIGMTERIITAISNNVVDLTVVLMISIIETITGVTLVAEGGLVLVEVIGGIENMTIIIRLKNNAIESEIIKLLLVLAHTDLLIVATIASNLLEARLTIKIKIVNRGEIYLI